MGRKVICTKCNTIYEAKVVENMLSCPVCGTSFDDDTDTSNEQVKEKHTYYYYNLGGGGLTTTLYDDETPLYTFEAVDMKDAERQLKEVMPNSPLINENSAPETRCPYCRSKEIQLVPKRFTLLTGIATNRFDRVCVHCKRRF